MWKYKCFFDFKKEEKWLEDMSNQGYRLRSSNGGFYQFDFVNVPGDFNIKIDYRTFYKNKDFTNYCSLFEDSGWKHIAGTKWTGSQYFVKSRSDASDDIFSDKLSRAGRYKRVSYMWLSLAICYFPVGLIFYMNGTFRLHDIQSWKTLYLTPGLWDSKGNDFIFPFLFETPFAFLRGFGWTFFLLIVFPYLYYGIKSYILYKKELG